LAVQADAALAATRPEVALFPLAVLSGGGRAVAHMTTGTTVVFFLDRGAFVEPDGFWVRGGQSATVVIAPADGAGTPALEVMNGPVANRVTIESGGRSMPVPLEPGELRVVPLGPGGGADTPRVRVASSAGFRPSEHDPATGDERWLGVRVRVVE
jgi:hypothetical protein